MNMKDNPNTQPLTMESLTTTGEIRGVGETLPETSGNLTAESQPAYIGIDFGTSTTVVSVARLVNNILICDTVPIRYKTFDGIVGQDDRIPTMLAYKDGKLLAGKGAEEFKYDLEKDVAIWYSFKMELGEDLGNKYCRSIYPDIKSPKDAAKVFFKYLRKQIEKCVPASKYEYAVTIPASFEANQRKDLVEALEANGINVNRQSLIDEPNAAFLSSLMEDEKEGRPMMIGTDRNPKVLVFDYGAGTCDVSILEVRLHQNGAYSKNIALSRFSKCGGDDIDRCIAKEILLPQLLKQMGMKESSLSEKQLHVLLTHLRKPAEALKIEACSTVSNKMEGDILPPMSNSDDVIKLNADFDFEYEGEEVSFSNPRMTFAEFNSIMKNFLRQEYSDSDTYNSIFKSIDSAVRKSGCSRDGIDYVLLIGGSSYNPYVQYALRESFRNAIFRIPRNLQSHVSQGAAIHSLVYSRMGYNIISPISSEPVMVITKDAEGSRIIVPAGTDMPSDEIEINDLVTSTEGQKQIEMPICVGSTDRILSNFIISCPDSMGFHKGEKVLMHIRFTSDKLIKGNVTVRGREYEIKPLNPLSNERLNAMEEKVRRAQRAANNSASENGGEASAESLRNLADAYRDANQHLMAAETLEELNKLHPGCASLNNIALEYGHAGRHDKETEYYERALKENASDGIVLFNYAVKIRNNDPERYQELMEKALELSPYNPCIMFEYGRWLTKYGNAARGKGLINKSLHLWEEKRANNRMQSWDYSWYSSALEFTGEYTLANTVRNEEKKSSVELYNHNNLTEKTY